MRTCQTCPKIKDFENYLKKVFKNYTNDDEDTIEFKQWISTDRCNLETLTKPIPDFIEYFALKVEKLVTHSFIARQQSVFFKECKENLKEGELFVSLDFSENYTFVIQNEAQGYHWNNKSATIHPFVVYFKDSRNELQHYNFVIISECLNHDSVSVHLFISKLLIFLKGKFPIISKIYYISDGAAAQYKCFKNFINIAHHKNDFGIECEWHFHATSHGKGPCDGLGGTLKRKATNASLARAFEGQIQSAEMLFKWAKSSQMDIYFEYSNVSEYEDAEKKLKERFSMAQTVKGTQRFHCVKPKDENYLIFKYYSLDNTNIVKKITITKK